MQKMAPPPHATRIPTRFRRGATFNIVGPNHLAYVDVRVSNNIENGTSAACGPFPGVPPFPLCPSAPPPRGRATIFSRFRILVGRARPLLFLEYL